MTNTSMHWAAIAATLILSSCASGARPTPAIPDSVNLSIAPAQLRQPRPLPQPERADDSTLLANHVAVAQAYHDLADQLRGLICTLARSQGITINGIAAADAARCQAQH